MKMGKISALEEVLQYKNDQLILMFSRRKGVSICESSQLFIELKKWLWFLAQRDQERGPFAVFPEHSIIDDYWHEFILSTKDYHAFCEKFFGRYIHHVPTPDGVLEDGSGFGIHASLAISNHQIFMKKKLDMLRQSMCEVEVALGKATMKKWYLDFPRKYFYSKNNGEGSGQF